jgi:single-strand DNA-binding protein
MTDINKTVLIGRLVRDPELKSPSGGTYFCRFTLASNHSQKKSDGSYEDKPGFFDCVVWGKQAETVHKYVSKGQRLLVEGSLRWSSWEHEGKKNSKVEINVEQFNFIERKQDSQPGQGAAHFDSGAMGDESIPF